MTEPFNSTIQSLQAAARGCRNFDHDRTRILCFLGRLNLHTLSIRKGRTLAPVVVPEKPPLKQ